MIAKTDNFAKKQHIVKKLDLYQKTERNTTIARARSAKQYNTFLQEKDLYPNIKWIPSRSADPREAHRLFYGKVLPADHPFWQENFPGNLWNCKCDWTHTDEPVTSFPQANVKPHSGLEGNPAITGEIFSEKTTWFKKAGKEGIEQAEKEIKKNCTKKAKTELKNKLIHQSIIMNGEQKEIQIGFSARGIRHLEHDGFPNLTYKSLLMPILDEVVKVAVYVGTDINGDIENNPMVNLYHYFKVILLGEKWYLNVRELKDGKFLLYSLTQRKEGK